MAVKINQKPGTGQQNLTRSLEKILEEAHCSGELSLSNRKLKDFPKPTKEYNLSDTIIAGNVWFPKGRKRKFFGCGRKNQLRRSFIYIQSTLLSRFTVNDLCGFFTVLRLYFSNIELHCRCNCISSRAAVRQPAPTKNASETHPLPIFCFSYMQKDWLTLTAMNLFQDFCIPITILCWNIQIVVSI